MLAGHYAPALMLHRTFANVPLWALMIAAQAVDIGFMVLGLFGIEGAQLSHHEPKLVVTAGVWTHSLPATVVWALAGGVLAAWLLRDRRAGIAIGLAIASHWLCDLLVHTPDLPLGFTQEPAVGLGLWLHPPWAWGLECGLLVLGTWWLRGGLKPAAVRVLLPAVGGLLVLQTLAEFIVPTPVEFAGLAASAMAIYILTPVVMWRVDRAG